MYNPKEEAKLVIDNPDSDYTPRNMALALVFWVEEETKSGKKIKKLTI